MNKLGAEGGSGKDSRSRTCSHPCMCSVLLTAMLRRWGRSSPAGAARFPSSVPPIPKLWLPAGLLPMLSHEVQALTLSLPADLTLSQCPFLFQILKWPPSGFGKEAPAKLHVMPFGHLRACVPSRAILRTLRNLEVPFLTNRWLVDRLSCAYIMLCHLCVC